MCRRPRRKSEVFPQASHAHSTVIGQEIEKTENETILSSLLMPWELGLFV